jgi:hypothetical protein
MTEELKENEMDLKIKEIKNPYVLILGISKYGTKKLNPIPAAVTDAKILEDVFKNEYKYKHVVCSIDRLEMDKESIEQVETEDLTNFFRYHALRIGEINETENIKIDGFVCIISSHGSFKGILTTNGKDYRYDNIHKDFNDENLECLINYPKIFIYDCCRGMNVATPIISGKGSNSEQKIMANELDDSIYWFATNTGYVALGGDDSKHGSCFARSIVKVFKHATTLEKPWNIGEMQLKVNQLVKKESESKQTPEFSSSLDYQIYFKKSN